MLRKLLKYSPVMAVLVLAKNGPRTKSGSIFWSDWTTMLLDYHFSLPEMVLYTLPVLVPLYVH